MRSGNDLKPFRLIAFRYMESQSLGTAGSNLKVVSDANGRPAGSAPEPLQRRLRGGLLGLLLAAARAAANLASPTIARPRTAVVRRARPRRRPRSLRLSPSRASRSCSADLKSMRVSRRELDLAPRTPRPPPRPSSRSRARGSRRRSPPRHTRGSGRSESSRVSAGMPLPLLGRGSRSRSGTPSASPDLGAGDAADRLVEDLGQLADVGVGKRGEELGGDGEPEHAVAEEGEPPVGARRGRSVQEEWVSAWRRSSSGGVRTAPPATRRPDRVPASNSGGGAGADEVHGVADRLDLRPPPPR